MRRPRRRLAFLAVVGCVATLAAPAVAFAHANLIRVEPADGTVVAAAPAAVRLFFDGPIHPEPGMRAVRDSGRSVLGAGVRVDGGLELVMPLRRHLPPGAYTLLWRVLSNDGHPVAGVTTFAVGAGQPRPRPALVVPAEQRAVPGFERWLFLCGVLLAVGLAVFRIAMPRAAAPSLLALCVGFVLTVGGGVALVERASLSTRFGVVVAAAAAIAIVGAIGSIGARFVPRLAAAAWLCGLALVVAPSAAGHALDPGRSRLEFPLDVLHVVGSSVWLGGVVALALAARQGELRENVVRRFSALALAAVVVIGATGIARAFSELGSFAQLWGTGYGRLLIVKTVLFAALAVIGWVNRYRLIPAFVRSAGRLRRNLRLEILLLLSLIGAVALLTQTQPGRDQLIASAAAAHLRAPPTRTPQAAVVLAQAGHNIQVAGQAANALSSDGTTVLWETIPADDREASALAERNLDSGRTRILARNVASAFGLAETNASIVYATATVPLPRLVALNRRSGRLTVLTDALTAPLAWRGDRVAWAEQQRGRQRILVYDLKRHTTWTAADLPACIRQQCYRIGAVTLAEHGVVFDRETIGSDTSYILRRAFTATHPQQVTIAGDPQPDLVPSTTGALYYALDRGWYQWDFGQRQPHPAPAFAATTQYPITHDGSRWLLLQHHGCNDTVVESLTPGRTTNIASPASARTVAGIQTGICVRLQGITSTPGRPVATWTILPHTSHPTGATSVIVIGPPNAHGTSS